MRKASSFQRPKFNPEPCSGNPELDHRDAMNTENSKQRGAERRDPEWGLPMPAPTGAFLGVHRVSVVHLGILNCLVPDKESSKAGGGIDGGVPALLLSL